jgi:acetyl-CoA synthetase (ADP-forming)
MVTGRGVLHRLLCPQSVAVIGAAETEEKWGGRVMLHLKKHGFSGHIAPVTARQREILGLPAYPSITEVPYPVDVAVVVVRAERAVDAVRDCASAGVRVCVIIAAQFAEIGGEGMARQEAIVRIAQESGMRLLGPNCLGLINAHQNLGLSPSLALATMTHLPVGGIGLVSQSGALMGSMLVRGFDIGAGFSACVSVGNQADLELCDFFEHLIDDQATRVICLYLEGLLDAGRFVALARRARDRGKPVLAAKAGRTEPGTRAVRSHTASLAGGYAVFEAVCAASGVVVMLDALDLVAAAEVIIRQGRMPTDGIAVLSGSGGSGALWTDAIHESGLRLGRLGAATRAGLSGLLPETHCDLPIDLGIVGQHGLSYSETITRIVSAVMADPDIGAGFYVMTTQPDMPMAARAIAAAGDQCGKPLLYVNAAGSSGEAARRILREMRYLNFDSPDEALRILKALAADYALRKADEARTAEFRRDRRAASPDLQDLPRGALTEPESKSFLARFSIPVTREYLAASRDAAAAWAAQIGYPVVLKGVARGLLHKSDAGAVRLGLDSRAAVREAFDAIHEALAHAGFGPEKFVGCLVQEMVNADAELLLGARHDPQFGPIVVLGAGGTLAELVRNVQLIPAPVAPADARAALRRLKFFPLLEGYRARPRADLDRIVEITVRVGEIAALLGPALVDLDINPLMVSADRVVAADAKATLANDDGSSGREFFG